MAFDMKWLKTKVRQFGFTIHAQEDARAKVNNWDITETHWGLGRQYHDRRWNNIGKHIAR